MPHSMAPSPWRLNSLSRPATNASGLTGILGIIRRFEKAPKPLDFRTKRPKNPPTTSHRAPPRRPNAVKAQGARHGRHRSQDHRRGHQPALQLGPRAAGARHHGRRFRGARGLPPAPPLPAVAREAGAGQVRARRAAGASTSTTSATSPRPRSASGSATSSRAGRCSPAPASRSCGTSARPPCTTSSTRRGSRRRIASAGLVGLRGTVDPAFGLMKRHAEEIASILREAGVADMPIGVDIIEPPMMFELEKAGLKVARRPAGDAGGARDQVAPTRSRCSTAPPRWSTAPIT